jgi:SulP family sulfate permease
MMMEREKHSPTPLARSNDIDQLTSPIPDAGTVEDGIVSSSYSAKTPSPSQLSEPGSGEATPMPRKASIADEEADLGLSGEGDDRNSSSGLRRYLAAEVEREDASESTPLLGYGKTSGMTEKLMGWRQWVSKLTIREVVEGCVVEPVKTLPATILGLLLNVLDGVSYGMIL